MNKDLIKNKKKDFKKNKDKDKDNRIIFIKGILVVCTKIEKILLYKKIMRNIYVIRPLIPVKRIVIIDIKVTRLSTDSFSSINNYLRTVVNAAIEAIL